MNRLIKLEKHGCMPCVMVDDFLKQQGVEYEKINIDDNPFVAQQYGVTSVPVVILLDGDNFEIDRVVGVGQGKIKKLINQL